MASSLMASSDHAGAPAAVCAVAVTNFAVSRNNSGSNSHKMSYYKGKKPNWWKRLSNAKATKAQRRAIQTMDCFYGFVRNPPDIPYGTHISDWSEIFGSNPGMNQVWLELGCGRGENLLALAHRFHDKAILNYNNVGLIGAEINPVALGNLFVKLQHAKKDYPERFWQGYVLYGNNNNYDDDDEEEEEENVMTYESIQKHFTKHDGLLPMVDPNRSHQLAVSRHEWSPEIKRDANDDADNHDLYRNVRIFKGDGMRLLKAHIANESVDRILITFPDPFPKACDEQFRLFQKDTVQEFWRVLKPNGLLCLATDHEGYWQWSHHVVLQQQQQQQEVSSTIGGGNCGSWQVLSDPRRMDWLPAVSAYEYKGWTEGRPTRLACWRKTIQCRDDQTGDANATTNETAKNEDGQQHQQPTKTSS